jgi:hypothetical protein
VGRSLAGPAGQRLLYCHLLLLYSIDLIFPLKNYCCLTDGASDRMGSDGIIASFCFLCTLNFVYR